VRQHSSFANLKMASNALELSGDSGVVSLR